MGKLLTFLQDKMLIIDIFRILALLPPKMRWKVYALFIYMLLAAILEAATVLAMTLVAITISAPQMVMENSILQWFFTISPPLRELCSDPQWLIFTISLFVVFFSALKSALQALLLRKQSYFSEEVAEYAADCIMTNYLNKTYEWHLSSDSNKTIIALNSRHSLGSLLMQIFNVYAYAITAMFLLVVLVSAMPAMIFLVLVLTTFICWLIYSSMKKALDKSGEIAVESSARETRAYNNAIHGIREVLIYRQQDIFKEIYLAATKFGKNARSFLAMAPPIPTYILEVYGLSVVPITTWILIHFYDADMVFITGALTLCMFTAYRVLPLLNRSLSSLVVVRSVRPAAMICVEKLEEIKNENMPTQAVPDPNFKIDDQICLDDVTFYYPGSENPVLQHITCSFPRGRQIGIVGISGSGKSTLATVLSGLLDPTEGRLMIDGKTLNPAELSAYRTKIGYVPQNPFLMAGSVAENVSFSQWGRPWDEEKVRKVCEMAALDLVLTDERGINYPIGESGAGLSGGQAQRVSIARALYADPEVLIMDESTSSLDLQTEEAIMETIQKIKGRVTIIIIAHRLATVEHCDWILWISGGRLYKQGPTSEILPEYRESLKNHQ